jgi:magnesium-transporting ATPase (P-type)
MTNNLAVTVLISIVIAIVLIGLTEVGMSIYKESPNYSDYCKPSNNMDKRLTKDECLIDGGRWLDENNYCEQICNQERYDKDSKIFNQQRFYIIVTIGLLLILAGLFITIPVIQWSGISAGGVLIIQSIVMNFQDKISVFIYLIIILIVVGLGVWYNLYKK